MAHERFLLRQELAHAGRVSTLAQLATGLAHELSQPLSAILRNAEAGALLLRTASPSLDDLNAILVDIRKDDERAGNVIDRMRRLLKRQTLAMEPLSVGSVVDDVVGLVRADAASRQVNLHLNIPVGLPQIRGDRVLLQQVLLNLVLNGMDALNGTQRRGRGVNVAARLESECLVEVAVSDDGPGIANWALANLFDPFFTTKPGGMGLGLPISRAIVEAHGGRLWAADNTGGGAVFCFTLPVADIGIAAD
jgi:C4-dicarboxylate-specific signal transduction histidine kinase